SARALVAQRRGPALRPRRAGRLAGRGFTDLPDPGRRQPSCARDLGRAARARLACAGDPSADCPRARRSPARDRLCRARSRHPRALRRRLADGPRKDPVVTEPLRPEPKRVYLIGTDTNSGKTTVACSLLQSAQRMGIAAVPFKPAESGPEG